MTQPLTLKDVLLGPDELDPTLGRFAQALAPFYAELDPREVVFDGASGTWKLLAEEAVHLHEGTVTAADYLRAPFEDTEALEWRALQSLIRRNKRDPASIFATPETRRLMASEPEVSEVQLDRADGRIAELNRWVRDARLELLAAPDANGVRRGVNPISGEPFEVWPDALFSGRLSAQGPRPSVE